MGYAKDIKAWVCPQEISRREEALSQWAALLHGACTGPVEAAGPDVPPPARSAQQRVMRPGLIPSLDSALAQQDA
jgi:hypothetical protein